MLRSGRDSCGQTVGPQLNGRSAESRKCPISGCAVQRSIRGWRGVGGTHALAIAAKETPTPRSWGVLARAGLHDVPGCRPRETRIAKALKMSGNPRRLAPPSESRTHRPAAATGLEITASAVRRSRYAFGRGVVSGRSKMRVWGAAAVVILAL